MKLSLHNIGKRFKFHWIFRNVSLELNSEEALCIRGSNGSGKSTLLKVLSGFLSPSEGKVVFEKDGQVVKDFYRHLTYAAPYVDLIDQLTLKEHIDFHRRFKSFRKDLSTDAVIDILDLESAKDKQLKDFSSGMQQRVRIGLTVLSSSDLCILDEPTTNLDTQGFEWYEQLLKTYRGDTAIIIASNEERDFVVEGRSIDIRDYKKKTN